MKKTILCIIALTVILSTTTVTALAAGANKGSNICVTQNSENICSVTNITKSFKDENNDGICDNYESKKSNIKNRKRQKNKSEYKCNSQKETGGNYTDKNNDGICDNYSPEKCNRNDSENGMKSNCQKCFRVGQNKQ